MASDFSDDDLQQAFNAHANAGVAATTGVMPEHAVTAIQHGPAAGVPADVGMRTPDDVMVLSGQRQQQNIINLSPQVSRWAQTAPPAHVAATKDDFPALAGVANKFLNWNWDNLKAPFVNALADLPRLSAAAKSPEMQEPLDWSNPAKAGKQVVDAAKVLGGTLGDLLSLTPAGAVYGGAFNAGIVQPYAQLSNVIPTLPGETREQLHTKLEKQAQFATLFAAPAKGLTFRGPIDLGTAREVPPANGPQIEGPKGPAPETPADFIPHDQPVPPVGVSPVADAARGGMAHLDQAAVTSLQESIAGSKTFGRSPEVMEQFIAQQVPNANVQIDPDRLIDLTQQGHDVFPAQAQEIYAAAQNGEQFQVSMAKYLAATSGQPFAESLNAATNFRPEGLSVEESEGLPPPSETQRVTVFHGGGDFDEIDPKFFGFGEPGNIRPLGKGLYGGLAVNPEDMASAIELARVYTKYGKVPTIHAFQVDLPNTINNLNYGNNPAGWARTGEKGLWEAEALPWKHAAGAPTAKEIAFTDVSKLRRIGKFAGNTSAEDIIKALSGPNIPNDFSPKEADLYRNLAARSEAALDEIVKSQRIGEIFQDNKATGVTKDQFSRYGLAIDNAIGDATAKLQAKAEAAVRRERTPEWKERVVQHEAAVEGELAQTPAIRARAYLAQGKDPLGAPIEAPFKIDREDVIGKLGKDRGLPDSMFRRDGISADDAAEILGYDSGFDLIQDLVSLHEAQGDMTIAQHMKAMIKAGAMERTRAELGFDLTPDSIREAASESFNSPAIEDFLADELQAYANENNLPFDKQAIKDYTENRFLSRNVSVAANPKKFEELLGRDSRKMETAFLKGNVPAAFRWRQLQYMHQLELGMSHKLLKEVKKAEKLFARIAKEVKIEGVSQDALNWSKDTLATMGLPVKGNLVDLEALRAGGKELRDFIAEKNGEGADITPVPIPRGVLPKDTPVRQFQSIANMLTSIMKWGRRENQVERQGKLEDLNEAVQQGIDSLARYDRTISDLELNHPNMLQQLDTARRVVDSWLVRLEQLMRDFGDRDPNSPFFQIVSRRLQERKAYANDTRIDMAKHFHEVAEATGKRFDKWLDTRTPADIRDLVHTDDGSPVFVKNRDILMSALHLGDQDALETFADGFNSTPEEIEAIVKANATPEMWKAVKGIWQAFEKLQPEAFALYKRTTGVTPESVRLRQFSMPDGSVNKGGYFPIRRDMSKMPKEWVKQQESLEHMLGAVRYYKVAPSNGYIKSRTQGARGPIDMSLRSVYGRIQQTIHDIAFREVLADVNRFLLHPKMVEAIARKYGPEYVDKIRADLRDIAGSETRGRTEENVGKALDYLSEGQMVNMIGFSPKTMVKHGLTAQAQSISEVGPVRYAVSFQKFMLNPQKMAQQAEAESADIRHILSTYNEDAFNQYMRLSGQRTNLSRKIRSYAFHFVGASNYLTAVPLYDAAKLKIADEHPELDKESVQAAAGQIVRQALGSAGPVDAPIALRMRGGVTGKFFRLTNPFLTFLSHMYNKQREIGQAFGFGGDGVDIGRGLAILVASIIIPTYIEQAVSRGELKMGKKLINILGYWASGLIHNEFGGVPIVNTAVGAAAKKVDKTYPGGEDAITSIFGSYGQVAEDVNKHFVQGHPMNQKEKEKVLEHATIAAGYAARAPGLALVRFEHFLYELHHTPDHAFQDLIFGAHEGR